MVKVLSQCPFWLKEVSFLRHITSAKGVAVDPSKVQEVLEWESPTSHKISELPRFTRILPPIYPRLLQNCEAHDRRPRTTPSSPMRTSCNIHQHFKLLRNKKPRMIPAVFS